jgi:hypothetical protein
MCRKKMPLAQKAVKTAPDRAQHAALIKFIAVFLFVLKRPLLIATLYRQHTVNANRRR